MKTVVTVVTLLTCSIPLAGATVVPMELSGGRPSIELTLNGKGPYKLLFDTCSGAGLILDEQLSVELGLKPTGTQRIGDPNSPEAIEAQVINLMSVALDDLVFSDVKALTWKRQSMGISDPPRGVVGLGLFGPRIVTLDYPQKRLLIESGALPEADGKSVLNATFHDGVPSLPIDVAGVAFQAHLDSGSTGFLGLPAGAAKTLPLEAAPTQVGRARTASGDYAVLEARLKGSVKIGALGLENPRLRFIDLPSANLGSDLLRTLIVSIDRENQRVRLVSAGKPLEPSARPRLGVVSYGLQDGRMPVEGVTPGSPAEAAGVRGGDKIVRLNGRAVSEMSTAQIGEAMQGRPLTIALLRDGQMIEIRIDR